MAVINIQPNQDKINYTELWKEIIHVIASKISSILMARKQCIENKWLCYSATSPSVEFSCHKFAVTDLLEMSTDV
jgi:hypothetical protein